MTDSPDPTYAPGHVDDVPGALGAVISSNGGQDFTRREGPGGRKGEFMSGAMRGAVESRDSAVFSKGKSALSKIFAGAAAVE